MLVNYRRLTLAHTVDCSYLYCTVRIGMDAMEHRSGVPNSLSMSESVGFRLELVRICTEFIRPAIMAASAVRR